MPDPETLPASLRCGRFELTFRRQLVMGIVNVTPDSFSDGGLHATTDAAIEHARRLVDEGADLLDIGGESTRPGAMPVGDDEEIARIGPVLEAMRDCGVPLSVDTRHAGVMKVALELGADMINDVNGFRDPGALDVVADSRAALCVMHMLGDPATMQRAPVYQDVDAEVASFLSRRIEALVRAGVARDRIVLDPGIGFGKTQADNLRLLRELPALRNLGYPVLIGLSRKSLIGHLTGRAVGDRLAGSLGGGLGAAERGAAILRVHDVGATRDALAVWHALTGRD